MKITFMAQWQHGECMRRALREAGHEVFETSLDRNDSGDVLFTDDDSVQGYKALCNRHAKVFLHPHGAGVVCNRPLSHPHVRGRFENSIGQIEWLRNRGCTLPMATIGWTFCGPAAFRPCGNIRRVLFAPTHVSCLVPGDPGVAEINQRVLRLLAQLPIDLTVRYVLNYQPAWYGEPLPGVKYAQGTGLAFEAADFVDGFDCVVSAAYTFPCIAIARGVPTVMYQQDDLAEEQKYPHDVSQVSTPLSLLATMHTAAAAEPIEWKRKYIGGPFNPQAFVKAFQQAVEEW